MMKPKTDYRRLYWHKIRYFPSEVRRWLLEDSDGGPPNAWAHSRRFISRQHGSSTGHEWWSIWFGNDAFDMQIATKYSDEDRERWMMFMAAEDFRKMALWYLWRWAWGEWFGLRRKLFYWDLHRRVKRFPKVNPMPEPRKNGREG